MPDAGRTTERRYAVVRVALVSISATRTPGGETGGTGYQCERAMMPSILTVIDGPPIREVFAYLVGQQVKEAADAQIAYNLVGQLYLSSSGWIMLSVPNAFVRGVFSAMHEPGIELPPSGPEGGLMAHITVLRPEEIEQIGGPDKVTERGKQFHYSLGRLKSVEPDGWSEMAKAWFVTVHSPELQALRRSYGLSSLPNEGKYDFHITVSVRRKSVLGRNDVSKTDEKET